MNFPEDDICLEHILYNFKKLIDEHQFTIESILNSTCNIRITYVNRIFKKRIEIVNQTKSTDYGFSIFVKDIDKDTYTIPINISFIQQDKECKFVEQASIDFFYNIDKLLH